MLGVGYCRAFAGVTAPMRCDARAFMEALDDRRRRAHLDWLLAERERNTVEPIFELDVVVDVGARALALP